MTDHDGPDDPLFAEGEDLDALAPDAPPRESNVRNITTARKRRKSKPAEKHNEELISGGPRVITDAPWEAAYARDQYGTPKATLANVALCLSQHEAWQGVIAYDAFAEAVITTRRPPMRDVDAPTHYEPGEWTEQDTSRFSAWFARAAAEPKSTIVDAAVATVAKRNVLHPVRDYLSALEWDGLPRLDRMLHTYFGAAETEYTMAVSSKWMLSAVARVFRPGCQADCMLILEGLQGVRKSTGLEALCPTSSWFSDSISSLGDKDSFQSLRRKWLIEIPELDAMRGREITATKRFVSGRTDNYRPSYGRRNKDFPRQCVFCGSTNEDHYLPDKTGNRRFWPVRCGAVLVENIRADRDQLWAEAVHRYREGEKWYLDTPELRRLAEAEQAHREQVDDWLTPVQRWLEHPVAPEGEGRRLLDLDDGITTYDVLRGAIGMDPARIEHRHTIRAGYVLRDLGFVPVDNGKPRKYRRAEPRQ